MEWIDATSLLPPAGRLVLAYLPRHSDEPGGAETMTVAYRWRGRWIIPSKRRLEDEFPGRAPSHWQWLPEMPLTQAKS